MIEYGYVGKLLRIDLTTGNISIEDWDQSWIGGKGFGQWLLFKEEPEGVGDFDPRRVIIFSTGPLNGTLAPSCAPINISSSNLLTGGLSTSSCAGFLAAELKYAGFDHLVITGKADRPKYLYIKDGHVAIFDASHLWGKTTWDTEAELRRQYADNDLRVACIGPAGENKVRFACIISERNRAAGWGPGALMGAKNLKAIAVRGTGTVAIADPSGFMAAVEKARERLEQAPGAKDYRRGGSIALIGEKLNPLTFRNYQDDVWDKAKVDRVSSRVYKENYEKRRLGCFNCTIGCGRFYEIKQGRYAGLQLEGVQINAIRGFGSNLDITSPEEIMKANAVANQYGLNLDGISSIAGWVFECVEKGILDRKDIGYDLRWGNIDDFMRLTEDITFRRGFGNILAEGMARAAKVIGRGSGKLAVMVKGNELNEGRMRTHRAWALGIVTSPRGCGHLDGAMAAEGLGFDNDVCRSVYGIPNLNESQSYENKAKLTVWTENFKMLVDMLGMCYFATIWLGPPSIDAELLQELYTTATGVRRSLAEIWQTTEKVINIQKAFNTLHAGFTRHNDLPPERFLNEPIQSGPFKGSKIDGAGWAKMLDEYYAIHGWHLETGWPTESGLRNLELDNAATRLAAKGRLIRKK